ncbi:helix-turn-helix domain-containing protein [Rhodococcoides kroppenstedtii]|uniref:helix-turn-helix domain-containing protein n=1 Tax=Rhodococcoides kroppenstedtii TaxID=293050 RepID=UPI0020305FD8|nr:helix-turn-helix domain-containing protein [Rhodococcus kroppenstedtii]
MTALRQSDAAALTATEVAKLFGVDQRTVSAAIANGTLPSVRIGRRVFVPREPLLAMLSAPGADATSSGNG